MLDPKSQDRKTGWAPGGADPAGYTTCVCLSVYLLVGAVLCWLSRVLCGHVHRWGPSSRRRRRAQGLRTLKRAPRSCPSSGVNFGREKSHSLTHSLTHYCNRRHPISRSSVCSKSPPGSSSSTSLPPTWRRAESKELIWRERSSACRSTDKEDSNIINCYGFSPLPPPMSRDHMCRNEFLLCSLTKFIGGSFLIIIFR